MSPIFIGLNQKALNFLKLVGRPACRKVVIEYEDGTSKVVSSHKFIEISYETLASPDSKYPLIAYYKDGKLLYEEQIQKQHSGFVFTALWNVAEDCWIPESLWNEEEIQNWI